MGARDHDESADPAQPDRAFSNRTGRELHARPDRCVDMAIRIRPLEGQVGDSVADVTPVQRFDGEAVIEGVY